MTSIHITVNNWGRMRLGNRYVWVDMHPYCGPAFFWDSKMQKPYEPTGKRDPIWPVFSAWLEKQKGQP